jgi:hypothetical protein
VNDSIATHSDDKRSIIIAGFNFHPELMSKFCAMTNAFSDVFSDVKTLFSKAFFDSWPSLTASEVSTCRIDDKMRLDHTVS